LVAPQTFVVQYEVLGGVGGSQTLSFGLCEAPVLAIA